MQQTFVLHTQNNATFVLSTKKVCQKAGPKRLAKKEAKKVAKREARKVAKKFIPEPVLLLS